MCNQNITSLKFSAIEYRQGKNQLFSFIINGKDIPLIASVSRLKRDEGEKLIGYQRPQVISHIAEIKRYLESNNPMIPNAIVIAFDRRLKFCAAERHGRMAQGVLGTLEIPTRSDNGRNNQAVVPGWVVDGQQRIAAIQEATIKSFPVCVIGFIAGDETTQREQFIRVNSAKPLPKDLIDELITETDAVLDSSKEKRKFPLLIRNRLNYDADSPLRGRIKTQTSPQGIIASSSVYKMIDHSLGNGVLFRYSRLKNGKDDIDHILCIVKNFWRAVASTFPVAWESPPSKSRLTHGAGIVSLGFVMDAICDRFSNIPVLSESQFARELQKIQPNCSWTSGVWKFGKGSTRKWNEVQNVPKDVEILTNYLVNCYLKT